MSCSRPTPIYPNESKKGVESVGAVCDTGCVEVKWYRAYPNPNTLQMAYNIYYSTEAKDIYKEGVKTIVTDPEQLSLLIDSLDPGDVIYFAVRATQFEPNIVDLSALPTIDDLLYYPEAALAADISDDALQIPVNDSDLFPTFGLLQIGAELIGYSSKTDGYLLLSSPSQRGMYATEARFHTVDGYDGYRFYDNPLVRFYKGFEERNRVIGLEMVKNEYPCYPSVEDGYHEKVDIVTSNLLPQQLGNEGFPTFDNVGWRGTTPNELFSGGCNATYIGGEWGCADGHDGVTSPIRGYPIQDLMNMYQEYQLNATGESVMLFQRQYEGKTSLHYSITRENSTHRGLDTHGTEHVVGYRPFYNPRRSDGRIMVRFDPTQENISPQEAGLENEFFPNCYTLSSYPVKDGDFFIRFYEDGSEEFRYMIIDVTRNKTFLGQTGAQKFTAARVRKTEPIYQVQAIRDTSLFPGVLYTSPGFVPGKIPFHTHEVIVNEGVSDISQINQTTSEVEGHTHSVIGGVIQQDVLGREMLGHTHEIILL